MILKTIILSILLSLITSHEVYGDEIFSKHYRKCSRPLSQRCHFLFGSHRVKKQGWFEFDYQYLNRQTSWANKKLVCNSRAHKRCTERAQKKAEEERIKKGIVLTDDEREREAKIGERAKSLLQDNIDFAVESQKEATEANLSVLTLGFSQLNYSCGFKSTVSQVVEKLSKDVLTSLNYVCDQAGQAMAPLYNSLRKEINELEKYGLAPNQLWEGKGVNVGIFAQGGLGVNGNLEAVVHGSGDNACMGLMCVSGVGLSYFAGAGVSASGVYTLGCKNNWEYLGSFVTIGATFRKLGGVEVGYSFGVDHHVFLDFILESTDKDEENRREYFEKINREMLAHLNQAKVRGEHQLTWLFLMKLINAVAPLSEKTMAIVDEKLASGKGLTEKLMAWTNVGEGSGESLHLRTNSIGDNFKTVLSSMAMDPSFPESIREIMKGANQALTGCDSMAIGISAGPQAGGGPLGRLTQYSLAGEIPVNDLEYASGLMVGGPLLMGAMACSDRKRFKKKMGNVLSRLKDIKNNLGACMKNSAEQLTTHIVRHQQITRDVPINRQTRRKHLPYHRHYHQTHPNHDPCSCGQEKGKQCLKSKDKNLNKSQ